jgi:NitT/TauT family transport system substrate-binding protein
MPESVSIDMRRRSLLALVPGALLIGAAGFAPSPLPAGERRTVRLAVGGVADITHLAVWYAKFSGLFDALKPLGIDVEVVPFGGGSDWLLALTSGRVDMAHGYYENGVRARSQGRDVILLDNIVATPGLIIVVRADLADRVKSVKDTAGMTWGVTSFGSATHAVALRVTKSYGLGPNDVKFIGVGGTTGLLPAIREKRVDVMCSTLVAGLQLIKEGSARELLALVSDKVTGEIYGHPYLGLGLLSSKAFVEKEPFATLQVAKAIRTSIARLKMTPPEEVARLLPAEFQAESIVDTIRVTSAAFNDDGEVSQAAAAAMIGDMTDLKLGRGMEPEATFDNRFIQAIKAGA